MKIRLEYTSDFFQYGTFAIYIDWNLPVLPSVGDTVHPLIPLLHDKDIYKKYSYQLNEEGRKSFDSFLEKGDDIESSFQAWILEEISDKDFVQHIKFIPDKEDCYTILPVIILGDYCERYE